MPARMAVDLPVVLPDGISGLCAMDEEGREIRASLTETRALPGGRLSSRIRFVVDAGPEKRLRVRIRPSPASTGRPPGSPLPPAPFLHRLQNPWLEVVFSEKDGVERFTCNGEVVGGPGFLDPFVTYGWRTFRASGYEFLPLPGETWDGLQRVRLKTILPMQTRVGELASELAYTFTLFDDLPYLFVDVKACYAYTPPRQVIHNLTQKLRRLIDLRWVETAPCQLTPLLSAPAGKPLRIWKHNFLGLTTYYDLNYGQINPRNRSLDAFNHQVTAGWVAVSNGRQGLLLGENASTLASMAFCPLRLREQDGVQTLSLNPFGSYYGRQLDYSHLGGNGNGQAIMQAFSGALQPNGPSFNGETLRFSLMLAPYTGDEPPEELQNAAACHFYPPGAIVHAAPQEIEAATLGDLEHFIAVEQARARLVADLPLDPPAAFLANPSQNAVDLVWDAPRAGPVTGYEIQWRAEGQAEWQSVSIDALTRWHLAGLVNGRPVQFRMRSLRSQAASAWTQVQSCTPGKVIGPNVASMLRRVPLWTLLRVVVASILSILKAKM